MAVESASVLTGGDERSGMELGRVWIAVGAFLGLLAVLAGALGAHALRGTLEPDDLRTFETAVRFQMYHALALLASGLMALRWNSTWVSLAGWLFVVGVVLFSGSLYALAATGIGAFGAIAPLGGVSLMAGWAVLVVGALRR